MAPASIQLPNLVALCKDFEVRTNNRCRPVSEAATDWALSHAFLAASEREALPRQQFGLLAALCYPTCDTSQLLVATQLLVLLMHWVDGCPGGYLNGTSTCAACEAAFAPLKQRILPGGPSTQNEPWRARLDRHLRIFHAARTWVDADNAGGVVPDLESYITLRRESSGAKLLFDLVEFTEGLAIPDETYQSLSLRTLEQNAVDAIAWSLDLVSYANKQAHDDRHNLVAVLIAQKGLAVQAAIQAAGKLVQGTLDAFVANERAFLAGLSGSAADADARRYVCGLRDCIVGCVYWFYESERFFGASGEDVRMFGWVFLPPKA